MVRIVLDLTKKELENLDRLLTSCTDSFDFSGDLIEVEEVMDKVIYAVQKGLKDNNGKT